MVIIQARLGTDRYSITLQTPIQMTQRHGDAIRITVEPSGASETHRFDFPQPMISSEVSIETSRALLTQPLATSIRADVNGTPLGSFDTPGLKNALATLDQCEARVLASWGLDRAVNGEIAHPAETIGDPPFTWFGADLYPKKAWEAHAQGRVVIQYKIDERGKPVMCRTVESSGNADLDQGTCDLVMSRHRFRPATDANGKAIASLMILPVRWTFRQ